MGLKLRSILQRWIPIRSLIDDQRGITAIEYGLIAAVMVIAIASTIRSLSAPITGAFQRVFDSFF